MTTSSSSGRVQFSLRMVLLAVAVFAIGVAYWKTYIWEPPTHRIAAYEKAPMFYGRTARIGPNQIRIESVARNDRDGSIEVESGRGEPEDAVIPNRRALVDCAKWLDVAQIDLHPGGDLVEIIDVRIFDHAKRELLSTLNSAYSWNVVSPNVLQIYGVGERLPKQLDVWLRVHSYSADDATYQLAPSPLASVDVEGLKLTIHEIQAGYRGWSSQDGLFPVDGKHHADCALEIGWTGTNEIGPYQIAAVTHDGEKVFDDRFITFNSGDPKDVFSFQLPLETISHFEIRRFGGMHRFFFDGVELPDLKWVDGVFANPPTAVVQVHGSEISTTLAEFEPLDLRLEMRDGNLSSGSVAGGNYLALIPRPDGPTELGSSFSLILRARGIGNLPFAFRFRQPGSLTWLSEAMVHSRGGHSTATAGRMLIERHYDSPIDSVDEVEISVTPAP